MDTTNKIPEKPNHNQQQQNQATKIDLQAVNILNELTFHIQYEISMMLRYTNVHVGVFALYVFAN